MDSIFIAAIKISTMTMMIKLKATMSISMTLTMKVVMVVDGVNFELKWGKVDGHQTLTRGVSTLLFLKIIVPNASKISYFWH